MSRVYFKVYRVVCLVLAAYLAYWALAVAAEGGNDWFPVFTVVAAMFALVAWSGLRTRKY